MKDKLPEQKKKIFNKNEENLREFISDIKSLFILILSYSVGLFIVWSVLGIISLIPESEQHEKERKEIALKQYLEAKIYEEDLIKAKIKFFENLSTLANKSQKEVINFLNQQQNNSLEISLTAISENLLELNFTINSFDKKKSYLIEFEHDKMKYITVRNAEPLEMNYLQKQHQKNSILEPSNKNMNKTYNNEPFEHIIKHIRVELKN